MKKVHSCPNSGNSRTAQPASTTFFSHVLSNLTRPLFLKPLRILCGVRVCFSQQDRCQVYLAVFLFHVSSFHFPYFPSFTLCVRCVCLCLRHVFFLLLFFQSPVFLRYFCFPIPRGFLFASVSIFIHHGYVYPVYPVTTVALVGNGILAYVDD